MKKIIIEVGSTNTKIDLYDGTKVNRLEEITILFKKHYKENGKLLKQDIEKLINKVLELKGKYENIFVCGTSIFRDLNENEKDNFLTDFNNKTGLNFEIITNKKENEYTAPSFSSEKDRCVPPAFISTDILGLTGSAPRHNRTIASSSSPSSTITAADPAGQDAPRIYNLHPIKSCSRRNESFFIALEWQ